MNELEYANDGTKLSKRFQYFEPLHDRFCNRKVLGNRNDRKMFSDFGSFDIDEFSVKWEDNDPCIKVSSVIRWPCIQGLCYEAVRFINPRMFALCVNVIYLKENWWPQSLSYSVIAKRVRSHILSKNILSHHDGKVFENELLRNCNRFKIKQHWSKDD